MYNQRLTQFAHHSNWLLRHTKGNLKLDWQAVTPVKAALTCKLKLLVGISR